MLSKFSRLFLSQVKKKNMNSKAVFPFTTKYFSTEKKAEEGLNPIIEPEVDPAVVQALQVTLRGFTQLMQLGHYARAQETLNDYKAELFKHFPEGHPAYLSLMNNQAILLRLNGQYEEALEIFEQCLEAYNELFG